MGELMTAFDLSTYGDIGPADQDGMTVENDTVLYWIEQPPFITTPPDRAEPLYGLKPPKSATEDWNREVPTNTLDETWEKTDYKQQYLDMLDFNPQAKKDLFELRMRLKIDDVCIISGSPLYPKCPRGIVYELLKGEMEQ